ncbi:hypothetical protein [Pseudomonas sp. NPDC087639]|uniref:hypothetical protein n=1 Tax=Pseudomonas sp. NPDC087639 TaxID=3364445 RepID=UPI0038278EFF
MNDIVGAQKLEKTIQQLMIDVTADDKNTIRTKEGDFIYTESNKRIFKPINLLVEAHGSETQLSIQDFVSRINEYLNPAYDFLNSNEQDIENIRRFTQGYAPYRQEIRDTHNSKTMFCVVTINIIR